MELLAVENIAQPKAASMAITVTTCQSFPASASPSKRTMPAQIPRISRPRRPKRSAIAPPAICTGRPASIGRPMIRPTEVIETPRRACR